MICGLEVPDFEASIAAPFADEDVQFFLIDVGESFDNAWPFLEAAGSELTCLLDDDGQVYPSYGLAEQAANLPPFPLYVVIDREGVIRYLSLDADPDAVRGAIEQALAL